MMHYINKDKKRLCGRNNQTVPPILFDAATEEPLQIQFITSNNQIVHLNPDELSGLYLAGNTKAAEPAYDLLFLSKDYTIENDILTFNYSTYTKNFLRKITKRNQEILIEIGQIALEKKTLLLRDYALANPRVYIEGSAPEDVDWSDFYTKEETQELLAQNLAESKNYTDEQIESIDLSQYATDDDLQVVSGAVDANTASISTIETDLATKASQADLDAVETKADTNSGNIQTLSGEVNSLAQDITGKAEQSVVDIISGTVDGHIADTTIHVTAADKTAWNGKLDPSALEGYATEQYVDGQVSGKADQSALTAHTSDTEIHTTALEKAAWDAKQNAITADNKLGYDLLSGTPDLSIYAKPNCLRLTAKAANSTVGLMLAGNAIAKNVEWSSDEGATWTAFTWTNGYTNVVTLANAGVSIILRCNDGQFSTGNADWVQFVLTGSIAASGNVMSLLSNDALLDEVPAYAFLNLFRDQTALVEAPELPAMKLNYRSYYCMFYGCSLAHAPKLPAEQYAAQCYGSMFGGGHQTFTSIEIAGQWDSLLGNDTSAMEKMFKGCSALNSVAIHWTNWPRTGGTTNWLQNVSATGIFYCPYGLPIIRDESHIPVGWDVVYTDVPESVLSGAAAATEALTMING